WPLALTAVAALLYRDPDRVTPDAPEAIFAPADGVVIGVEDLYEHRFLHTDAVRVAIAASPFDLPFHRSPAAGRVGYLEHVPGEYGPIWDLSAAERNERQYIGIKTEWGPLLLALIGGPPHGLPYQHGRSAGCRHAAVYSTFRRARRSAAAA